MTKDLMISTLEKYCDYTNTSKTGLLLLDLPTGFGKTYNTLKYIYDNYKTADRKIIFLTELKKNLPHETTLKKFFEQNQDGDAYKRDVLFIDSNIDTVIEHLLDVENNLPPIIRQNKTFKLLKNHIENYNHLVAKKNKSKYEIEYSKTIKDKIRSDFEPDFRNFVMQQLQQQVAAKGSESKKDKKSPVKVQDTNKTAKIKLIKEDKGFQWITKVYPAALSSEKRIFFMSVDKFLTQNTTLVESSFYFLNSDFFSNSLIFIDEFDASKKVILNHIIETQLRKRIDIVGLIEQIYSSLQSSILPEIFTLNQSGEVDKQMNAIICKIDEKLAQIKKDYKINYSIKTFGLRNHKNFLFHDNQYHTIVNSLQKYIYFEPDPIERINKIHFVEDKELVKDKPSVVSFLRTVYHFINYFKLVSHLIAQNFQSNKNNTRDFKDNLFSLENALKSFYAHLKISPDNQKYLLHSYGLRDLNKQKKKQDEMYHKDRSFYSTGFRCYDFEDSETHDTKSKVFMTDFDTTPEKMLLDLASNNLVVGISATAKLPSVLCNYDLTYIRKKLGNHFYELDEEENQAFKAIFEEKTSNYVPISAKFITVDDVKTRLRSFKLDGATYHKVISLFENIIATDRSENSALKQHLKNYKTERYLKIATVYQEFIKNDNIKSFLCFLNVHPEYEKATCDLHILDILFEGIIKAQQKEDSFVNEKGKFEVQSSYFVINSQDFEAKKTSVLNRLKQNKKLFLITTYRTLGAGQNIQYGLDTLDELLNKGKIKQIAKRGDSIENQKDFDAIYLDKPTHLLTNLNGDSELSDFEVNKRIFDVQMLHQDGEIFKSQVFYEIERTFRKAYYDNKGRKLDEPSEVKNLYETENYKNAVAKEVIQAIGRINRTNIKNNEIYVFADMDIAPHLKYFDTSKYICLKELEALVKAASYEHGEKPTKPHRLMIQIERSLNESHNWISRKINKNKEEWNWEDIDIKEWEALRELVLRYPTASKAQLTDSLKDWEFIYLPMLNATSQKEELRNSYYFTQEKDYLKTKIDFLGESLSSEVSAEVVFLPQLMQIKELKTFFESQGYATDFNKNEYMINPEIFNNIYKGALGEVIGKFLLENYVIYPKKLQSMPKKIYERFDFRLDKGIFIDFKFWNDQNRESRAIQIDKIFNLKVPYILKHKIFEFQKVFIINILADGTYFDIQYSKDGQLVEVPSLIDKQNFKINNAILSKLQNDFIEIYS